MIGKLAVLAVVLGGFFIALKYLNRPSNLSGTSEKSVDNGMKTLDLEKDPTTGKYKPGEDKGDRDA